ncbi:unnamed protein product, partial [Mycena citricolor]
RLTVHLVEACCASKGDPREGGWVFLVFSVRVQWCRLTNSSEDSLNTTSGEPF